MTVTGASPASADLVREALGTAAQAGPFFGLELVDGTRAAGWAPAARWYLDGLAGAVAAAARQLRTREPRVAASILQLDLAARLWSPVLGCGLLHGVVPDLGTLLVSTEGPVRLGLAGLAGWIAVSPGQLAALSASVVGPQLTELAAGLPGRLTPALLRGNSASAVAGALGVLTSASPGLAGPAAALLRALLATDDLRGAGDLAETSLVTSFRRTSCCLYYRVPHGGLCGDCCLKVRVR